MNVGEGNVSSVDRYTGLLTDTLQRMAATERLVHVHPPSSVTATPGMVAATISATAPAGWLLLDGSTVTGAQTLYPYLWAVAPTAWKSGASLILPDSRGRTVIGSGTGAGLTARTLGATVGVESVTLSAAESGQPGFTVVQNAHNHTQDSHNHTQSGHTHSEGSHTHTEGGHTHSETSHQHSEPGHTHGMDHDHGAVTSGAGSSHAHYSSLTSQTNGNHVHTVADGNVVSSGTIGGNAGISIGGSSYVTNGGTNTNGAHTHLVEGNTNGESAHTHSVDVAYFSGSTGSGNGSGTGFASGGSTGSSAGGGTGSSAGAGTGSSTATNNAATATNQSTTATNQAVAAAAAAAAHTNMQPSLVLNWIVKT